MSVWSGLDELRAELRKLPEDLAGEAAHIVEGAANAAAVDVKTEYGQHVYTGHLQDGVYVSHFQGNKFSAGAILKSASPLAWIFEHGTEVRHYVTHNGVTHVTGKMPPSYTFVRAVMRRRRQMYQSLKDLIVRHGLSVSGDVNGAA